MDGCHKGILDPSLYLSQNETLGHGERGGGGGGHETLAIPSRYRYLATVRLAHVPPPSRAPLGTGSLHPGHKGPPSQPVSQPPSRKRIRPSWIAWRAVSATATYLRYLNLPTYPTCCWATCRVFMSMIDLSTPIKTEENQGRLYRYRYF